MTFQYQRTIHFHDTDAAGVVYFANVLSICHEAYEASLQSVGIELRAFFGDRHRAIPIVHASVDFFQPMFCGETYRVELIPTATNASEFAITYHIYPEAQANPTPLPEEDEKTAARSPNKRATAKAHSRHVCIHPSERQRLELSPTITHWLKTYGV